MSTGAFSSLTAFWQPLEVSFGAVQLGCVLKIRVCVDNAIELLGLFVILFLDASSPTA